MYINLKSYFRLFKDYLLFNLLIKNFKKLKLFIV